MAAPEKVSFHSIIELKSLSLRYSGGVQALDRLSFQVVGGEHLAIMGASGSGKTSLLALLAGRLEPTSGTLRLEGGVATIHQDLKLVKERTAIQNVLDGAMGRYSLLQSVSGYPVKEKERAKSLLTRVGLAARLHHPVKRLSGGERQRVAIARALMQDPDIILADEPVASLDEENANELMTLISDLARERGLTVISVLHDTSLASRFADRILRLSSGKLVSDGTAVEVTPTKEFRKVETQETKSPVGEPSKVKNLLYLFMGLAVLVWSFSALNVTGRELDGMFGSLLSFLVKLFPTSVAELREIPWLLLLGALVETVQMALVGTAFSILFSWPMAALAAKNIAPKPLLRVMRLLLNAIRTIPSLIWALLFVAAVGLGTVAGILALVAYSIGYLSKFFYEAFEAVDPGPPQALKEIGASGLQQFLFAVWPAAKPAVLSSCLFMFEYNVRAASVLGVVDAGGIGYYIKQYIDWRAFPTVTASLFLLLLVVVALDALSTRVRSFLLS